MEGPLFCFFFFMFHVYLQPFEFMKVLPSNLDVDVPAWLEAHYAAKISLLSRSNFSATFGFPLLSPSLMEGSLAGVAVMLCLVPAKLLYSDQYTRPEKPACGFSNGNTMLRA